MTRYAHPADPATYDSSDGFGSMLKRRSPHKGIDYAIGTGTTVTSPCGGTVINAQWSVELGNVVGVAFDDGMFGGLAHNSEFLVDVGQRVELGTPLSRSGNTGSASQGPHLHFSLGTTSGAVFGEGYGSTLVDPYAYVVNHLTGVAGSTVTAARKESTVALYHKLGTTPLLYALAGGSPGTPANWLETTDPGFATQLARQAGDSAGLSADSFEAFKKAYLAPVNGVASAPGAPTDNAAILKALADLPTAIAAAIILEQKKPGN